ncbi:MAG: hypothetical protein PUB18_02360 [bacterium]|nr:hypothetical protein [bacterium]
MKNVDRKKGLIIGGILVVILASLGVLFFVSDPFKANNQNKNLSSSLKQVGSEGVDAHDSSDDHSEVNINKDEVIEEGTSSNVAKDAVIEQGDTSSKSENNSDPTSKPAATNSMMSKNTNVKKNTSNGNNSNNQGTTTVTSDPIPGSTTRSTSAPTPNVTPQQTPSATTTPSATATPTPVVETQEMKNEKLRSAIQTKYGVTIKYGAELPGYRPRNADPIRITNAVRTGTYLQKIDEVLATYPNGFFRDFINKGMPLTIFLVESMQGNVFDGFFDSEFYSDLKLTMTASTYWFERTLNHELMHYIDAYLSIVMYPNSPETDWIKLNPTGYVYGSYNQVYNFQYSNPTQGYFTKDYGQSNYKEDRATIFEDMMIRAYKNAMYNDGVPIKEKAKLISSQIRQYFPSVNGQSTHWDRFLN